MSPPPQRRILGGYLPVVVGVVVMALVVALLPSRAPIAATAGGLPTAGAEGQAVTGDVEPCPDRELQVPESPYSPPCFAFDGDNGGATSRGVSADTIRVAYRVTPDTDYASVIQQMASVDFEPDTPESVQRTLRVLTDWFNQNFEFYGRKIELVPYDGKGTVVGEIFGGGQDAATADAVKVDSELDVFADISAITEPYANALTRRGIISLSPPYVSDEWFHERRPYGWSLTPSCTLVSKAATEYGTKRLFGEPARWAGDGLQGQPRKIAVISPDNPEYQRCADEGEAVIREAGFDFLRLTYTLDLATMSNQATSLVAKLKSEGITSVGCACDPLLPVFLTSKATEQGYNPEWLVMGTALTDNDFAGQLYDQEQWSRAFGASALGDTLPLTGTEGYLAYKSLADDEPAFTTPLLYFQLYLLAIGIQMAGPDLTPETFELGMLAYPERYGEAGTWKFLPGKYTPQIDAREIYWDPERISAFDLQPGAYVPGRQRYRLGEVPTGDPEVFDNAPPPPDEPDAPPGGASTTTTSSPATGETTP